MSGASRHQHDTLDQIREHLEAIRDRDRPAGGHPVWTRSEHGQVTHYGPGMDDYHDAVAALAKFDARLAEGRIQWLRGRQDSRGWQRRGMEPCLVIPLPVGCGNTTNEKVKP